MNCDRRANDWWEHVARACPFVRTPGYSPIKAWGMLYAADRPEAWRLSVDAMCALRSVCHAQATQQEIGSALVRLSLAQWGYVQLLTATFHFLVDSTDLPGQMTDQQLAQWLQRMLYAAESEMMLRFPCSGSYAAIIVPMGQIIPG